jgi:hypothetical protein
MNEQCVKCEQWFKDDDIFKHIAHTDIYYCKQCYFHNQPERLNPEASNSLYPLTDKESFIFLLAESHAKNSEKFRKDAEEKYEDFMLWCKCFTGSDSLNSMET